MAVVLLLNRTAAALVVASMGFGCVGTISAADSAEQTTLSVDGRSYTVPVGKPFIIKIGERKVRLEIAAQTNRTFSEAGVSFNYPRSCNLSVDDDDQAVTLWTLEANDATLIVQHYGTAIEPTSLLNVLVENLVKQYGKANVKQQKIRLTGKERKYNGVRLATTLDGVDIVQNIITFANQQGGFALILQDTGGVGENSSDDYRAMLDMLGKTLETGPPPKPVEPPADAAPATTGATNAK